LKIRSVIVFSGNSGVARPQVQKLLEDGSLAVYSTYNNNSAELFDLYRRHGFDPQEYCLCANLSNYVEVETVVHSVSEKSQLWAVLNFCGTSYSKRIVNSTPTEIILALTNNLHPALWITKAFINELQLNSNPGGRIVHFSSVTTKRPVVGAVPYIVSKFAIEGLVKSFSLEAGRAGVTINGIRLGYMDSGMTAEVPDSILQNVVEHTSVRRLGASKDVSAVLDYILADNSSFLTGTVLDLNGGLV